MDSKIFQVPVNKNISLQKDFDPSLLPNNLDKPQSAAQLQAGIERLAQLQNKLYAQNSYSILIIFQAMDAAGKDSTIKHVMSGINPQGCQVLRRAAKSPRPRCMRWMPVSWLRFWTNYARTACARTPGALAVLRAWVK